LPMAKTAGSQRGKLTGSWNVAVRPRDGLSSATNEDEYTASIPVDTKEFISGDNRLSDASPDRIRLAPGTAKQEMDQTIYGREDKKGPTVAFLQ